MRKFHRLLPTSLLKRTLTTTFTPTPKKPMIELDGGTLEGGGQLLRNAVALSTLTRTPVRISDVRQNRNQPGLKAQHAAGLALVAQITNAYTEGIEKGSQCVLFDPTREESYIRAGEYEADPGTAGSTTLLLQVSLPCLLFTQRQPIPEKEEDGQPAGRVGNEIGGDSDDPVLLLSTLTLRGGTNAQNAPQADYAQHVLNPFLNTHILPPSSTSSLRLDIKQRGFYPHGGGLLRASIPSLLCGQTLRSVQLTDRGHISHIRGTIVVSGIIGKRVATEMRDAALLELFASFSSSPRPLTHDQITINIETNPSGRAGSSIMILAYTSSGCILAGSALGSKGTRASQTGQQAAQELVRHVEEGGCVDSWMQDQMVIFLALAKGRSVVRTGKITLHTRTAIWVAEQLTGAKFEVKENIDGTDQSLITCEGIGLEGWL